MFSGHLYRTSQAARRPFFGSRASVSGFDWGLGAIALYASDFVSVRWTGRAGWAWGQDETRQDRHLGTRLDGLTA